MDKEIFLKLTRIEYLYLKSLLSSMYYIGLSKGNFTSSDLNNELVSIRKKINKIK